MIHRYARFLVPLYFGVVSLCGQTALVMSDVTSSAGTGFASLTNTQAGKGFIDYYTVSRWSDSAVKNPADAAFNLVGGSSTASTATFSTSPMLQVQTAYIGGTNPSNLGVAFRLRLGSYDLAAIQSTGLTAIVGVGPEGNSDKATFGLSASITSDGSKITGFTINILDAQSTVGVNQLAKFTTGGSGGFVSSTVFATNSTGVDTSFVSYQSTGNNAFSDPDEGQSNDGWLTFGVTFAAVNNAVSSLSRTNGSGVVNPYDADTAKWNYIPVVAKGTNPATWNPVDAVGSTGNTWASDFVYTNGSPTTPSLPPGYPVPEPSTWIISGMLLLPAGGLWWRRRRATLSVR
ncbi:MAG: PEP-CTERM sorting domain-containing protein [Verrucomicrobia bacterium]|nr:PEP-CTERM sorting domain-containing protein [Verrucomicrobiota bacterium]